MEWPVLSQLSESDARDLLATAQRRTFAKGEVVFHGGAPADALHLVREGRFAIRVMTPLGESAILTVLGRGEFFGELSLVTFGAQRLATVTALEDAETLSIHKVDFDRVREASPAVSGVLIVALVAQLRRLTGQLVDALYVPVDARVLRRVHDLAAIYGAGDDATAVIPLTQEDIANLAGTSRATVNRVLREQERNGILELRRGQTVVTDREALALLAR